MNRIMTPRERKQMIDALVGDFLDPENTRDRVVVHLPRVLYDALKVVANKKGKAISRLATEVITAYVATYFLDRSNEDSQRYNVNWPSAPPPARPAAPGEPPLAPSN